VNNKKRRSWLWYEIENTPSAEKREPDDTVSRLWKKVLAERQAKIDAEIMAESDRFDDPDYVAELLKTAEPVEIDFSHAKRTVWNKENQEGGT